MLKTIIILISSIFIFIGVIGIFEARNISKKYFSFGDQNTSVAIIKIACYIISIIYRRKTNEKFIYIFSSNVYDNVLDF